MQFAPKSKEDRENAGTLPDGAYPFSVMKAERKISKAGNDMIKLMLRLYGPDSEGICTDYLMEAMPYKLGAFCELTGLEERYNSGELDADDCQGREGFVSVKRIKDSYGVKNEVKDYVPEPKNQPPRAELDERRKKIEAAISTDDEEEIPF